MQITPQIALYVLLLLPGLLGHALFAAFTYRAAPSWTSRTVVAILLTAASYFSIWLMRTWGILKWVADPSTFLIVGDAGVASLITRNTMFAVIVASGFSVIYALFLIVADNRRFLFKLARWLRITARSGFASEWDMVMLEFARDRWVMAIMKNESAFTGWLVSHDVASAGRAFVLRKVRQYDKDGEYFDWPDDELLY